MHYKHLTKYQKIWLGVALSMLLGAGIIGMLTRPLDAADGSVEVTRVVTDFGHALKNVSLTASPEILADTLETTYGPYVTPELLSEWQNNPTHALGRQTSSPWPERIEVGTAFRNNDGSYTVLGSVIEVTGDSLELAAVYPVSLTLKQEDGVWRIQEATKGTYTALPERRTIEGVYECLPQLQSTECVLGITTDQGVRFALDFDALEEQALREALRAGYRIRVEGTFVPVEYLSTVRWANFSIQGIVRVTSLEVL